MEARVFSVTELNNYIKELLDAAPMLANIAVKGELSNYKIYPSGHHYFTLKDAECSLRCIMFKGSASKLRFKPESGMGVTVVGRVSVYPRDGGYQLYASEIIPEGVGDLQMAFEQLKEKLGKEGLFAPERKKPIPRYPDTIAVITSSAGAAVRDIIRILRTRWPMAEVKLLPVRVQGTEAPAEIAGAIRYANAHGIGDVIITGRGGGSIEDLWAFNDERVARAIFDSVIPVISAVGHEPDVTISDFVADVRASTPSNAAERAVPDQSEIRDALSSAEVRLNQAAKKKLSELTARLRDLAQRKVLREPTGYIDQRRMELDSLSAALISGFERELSGKKHEFVGLAAALDALSPLKVLARGYSIVTDGDGRVVASAASVGVGDAVSVRLGKGSLSCTVDAKKNK